MQKGLGFTLTELLISLLIASSVSLAGVHWFQMTTSTVMAQSAFMDGNEAGRFSIRYLSDQIQRAGLGVDGAIDIERQTFTEAINMRYSSLSPNGQELFNCLGNRASSAVVQDEITVQIYEAGGLELRCSSGQSADWISENIHSMKFLLGVDQGRFINDRFIHGEFDRKVDAYITGDELNVEHMIVLAVKVFIKTYRPSELSMFSRVFWSQKIQRSESNVSREFQTTIFLPNS